MFGKRGFVAAAMAVLSCAPSLVSAGPVYAHFMVGIVEKFTVQDWKNEIQQAQSIGIDGFALNCAPPRVDNYTPRQLDNAYQAAEQTGFKMFISFDFAYWNAGDTQTIIDLVNKHVNSPAQAVYNGGAIVSTFVGDDFNWQNVKNAVGRKLTALPNIQDPNSLAQPRNGIDGAFSWYAWAEESGNTPIKGPMTTVWDQRFMNNLKGRPYMAPVSPWFSTHFGSKNWVFDGNDQPQRRWQQILDLKPALVEIVTWNDFGESHYISGPQPNHSDDGSSQWANGMPHDGWRTLYRPYIAAYKAGSNTPKVNTDEIVYWYRTTPRDVQCSGDSVGKPRGANFMDDVIYVSTLLTQPAQITVHSGGQTKTVNAAAGINTYTFPMGVGKQSFSLVRNGKQILGGDSKKDVSGSCQKFNFNAYVGTF